MSRLPSQAGYDVANDATGACPLWTFRHACTIVCGMHRVHMWVRPFCFAIALASLVACERGAGSRVPPFFADRPARLLVGQVLSSSGQAIVSAKVTIEGFGSESTDSQGRFTFGNPPDGTRVVRIDATNASAEGGDRFGSTQLSMVLPGTTGRQAFDLPFVMPELGSAPSATVDLGTQAAATTIDARANGRGATLSIPSGRVVQQPGNGTGRVELQVARIDAGDFEVPLPQASNGTWLPSTAISVLPEDVTIASSGGELSFENELGLTSAGTARVFRLDRSSGAWTELGSARLVGASIVPDVPPVDRGGVYVVAVEVATTTATGVLENLEEVELEGVAVSAFGISTRTNASGRFTLSGLPAVDASGANRDLSLRVHTGVGRVPYSERIGATSTLGTTDFGTRSLPIYSAGSARYFVAFRGEASRLRPVRIGASEAGGAHLLTDEEGFGATRGLSSGWVNATTSWVEGENFFRGETLTVMPAGSAGVDLSVLARQEELRPGDAGSGLFGQIYDLRTGAPIEGVEIQGGVDSEQSPRTETNALGQFNLGVERFGVTTASFLSVRLDGRTWRAAFSVTNVDNARVEFPLPRFERSPASSFDPHGLLVGSLVGAMSGSARRVLTHGYLNENDWFSLAMGAELPGMRLPRRVDPATTGGDDYVIGIPLGRASVAVLEGALSGSRFTPSRVAFLADLRGVESSRERVDLALSTGFSRNLIVRNVESSVDSQLAIGELEYRLGARLPDGKVLDVMPWSGGASADFGARRVLLPAPPASGALEAASMLGALRVAGTSGGVTRSQELYLTSVEDVSANFLPVPSITKPSPSSTVPGADEFDVEWDVLDGVDYYELLLVAIGARDDDRYWRVLLPGDATKFTFRKLVRKAGPVLGPGLEWKLTLRAHRIARGPLLRRTDRYQRIAGNAFSLRDGHVGFDARSSSRITFRTP